MLQSCMDELPKPTSDLAYMAIAIFLTLGRAKTWIQIAYLACVIDAHLQSYG